MVAIENAQAPGGKNEQPDAWEKNPHDSNGQRARLAVKSRRDHVDHVRSGQHADEHEDRRGEREKGRDGARRPARLFFVASREEARIHRNERRRKHAFAKKVLQEIGNAERRFERVGYVRKPEIVREHAVAHQPRDAAQENARRHEKREAFRSSLTRLAHPRSCRERNRAVMRM